MLTYCKYMFTYESYKINLDCCGFEIYNTGDYDQHAHKCGKPPTLNSVVEYISFSYK